MERYRAGKRMRCYRDANPRPEDVTQNDTDLVCKFETVKRSRILLRANEATRDSQRPSAAEESAFTVRGLSHVY